MRIAFDSDVLIYAADSNNLLGQKVRRLLTDSSLDAKRVGSVLLLPEILTKPTKTQNATELQALNASLTRLDIIPVHLAIATSAISVGAAYNLKTADATHLATAIYKGADQFLTNNRKDFKKEQVLELDILYPDEL